MWRKSVSFCICTHIRKFCSSTNSPTYPYFDTAAQKVMRMEGFRTYTTYYPRIQSKMVTLFHYSLFHYHCYHIYFCFKRHISEVQHFVLNNDVIKHITMYPLSFMLHPCIASQHVFVYIVFRWVECEYEYICLIH